MPRKRDKLTPTQMSLQDKPTAEAINAGVDKMIEWLKAFNPERPIKQLKRENLVDLCFIAVSMWVVVRSKQADDLNDPIDDLFPGEKSSSEMAHLLG